MTVQARAALAAVLLSCAGASMFIVEPLFLGAAADAMHLNEAALGWLAGAELLGAALGSFAAVYWVSRWPWRRVAATALLVIAAGNLISTQANSLQDLMVLRFLTGLAGQGTAFALALAIVARSPNPDRLLGLAVAAQVTLAMVGLVLMPGAIAVWGLAGVLLPLAAFALLLLPIVAAVPAGAGRNDAAPEPMPAPPPAVALGLLAQFAWYVGVGAVWAFVERMAAAAGIAPGPIGEALALGMGLGLAGALAAAALGGGRDRSLLFAVAMVLQAAALMMLDRPFGWWAFAVAITMFNVTWNFALPFLVGAIASADRSGRYTVLVVAAQGLGVAFGPVAGGHLATVGGLSAVVYLAVGCCVLGAALLALALRKGSDRAPRGSGPPRQ